MPANRDHSANNRIRVKVDDDVVGTIPESCLSSLGLASDTGRLNEPSLVRTGLGCFSVSYYQGDVSEIFAVSMEEARRLPGFQGAAAGSNSERHDDRPYHKMSKGHTNIELLDIRIAVTKTRDCR
jgi:hypothetical protein